MKNLEKTEYFLFQTFFSQQDVQLDALLTEQFYDRKRMGSLEKN